MVIETEVFGAIDYTEEDMITFSEGIYGFEDYKQFILVSLKETELPFQWLQSTEEPNLSFILTTPFAFHSAYDFEIPEHVTEKLNIQSAEDLAVYSLVVLHDELTDSTINLKAPLIINMSKKIGCQLILNEDYPYKYHFLQSQEV